MTNHADYFAYPRSRSLLGRLYRTYWLYLRIARVLTGRVLDIGCGIGDMLVFRPGTVGVDINPHIFQWNRRQGLRVFWMPLRWKWLDSRWSYYFLYGVFRSPGCRE